MRLGDLLLMSIESLFKRKVRTILTILGVIIGTISIVVMMSLGIGMKKSLMEEMESYGALTLIEVTLNNFDNSSGENKLFLDDETVAMFESMENVVEVVPRLQCDAILKSGSYQTYITLVGMAPEGFAREKIELGVGELPLDSSELALLYGNSIVGGFYNPKNYYYPYYETGEALDIDFMNDTLYLIFDTDAYFMQGSTDSNGQIVASPKKHIAVPAGVVAGGVEDYNAYCYAVFCNLDALKNVLKREFKNRVIPGQPTDKNGKPYREIYYSQLNVYADDMKNVTAIQQIINEQGYITSASAEWIESEISTINLIQAALGGIGAVSLLVAAIGIINTMMMSIYERTKEIGVMKVIGCRLKDIQMLFLFEAGFIGLIGGIIGIAISYGLSALINSLVAGSDLGFATISIIPWWLTVLAIVFSVIIGMIAGFIPSLRAMKLSPLEALRQ